MKKFIFSLIMIMSFQLTIQAETFDYEKPSVTITDHVDVGVLQITANYTNQRNNYNYQGLDILDFGSCGHNASITSSRYGENIKTSKGSIYNTQFNKILSSYSKFKASGQRNTSGMCLRRVKASGKALQGNRYTANRNYNYTKRYNYHFAKPNEFFAKDFLLYRINRCSYCDSIHRESIYETETYNLNTI